MPIRLRAFDLEEKLSEGGLGVVWRGLHRRSGQPVAAKLLTPSAWALPVERRAFEQEVRAVAGLDHPAIVRLFDYGTVDDSIARLASRQPGGGEGFVPGAPWFVMERAACDLRDADVEWDWGTTRQLLQTLLAGLAHAHARGVLHRDLKLSNVLLTRADDPSTALLADFGLAHPRFYELDPQLRRAQAGTPRYMAPEQIVGDWSEFGPWTDLYSLGVVAWRIAGRGWPYGPNLAPLTGAFKPWVPQFQTPDGFVGWLSRMLQPDTADRFPRAAEALAALNSLGEPTTEALPLLSAGASPQSAPEGPADDETYADPVAPGHTSVSAAIPHPSSPMPPPMTVPVVALPDHAPQPPVTPPRPIDTGRGLVDYRLAGFIGRHVIRDGLWTALCQAPSRGLQAVLIEGQAGVGKSRLAQWVAATADEVGAARILRSSGGTVRQVVADWLALGGVESAEVEDQIRAVLGRLGVADEALNAALLEFVSEDPVAVEDPLAAFAPRPRAVQPQSAASRRAGPALRLLARLSETQRLLVILDDVHSGREVLEFVGSMMASVVTRDSPIVVLATARRDGLALDPAIDELVDALRREHGLERHDLLPFSNREQDDLLRGLLGLSPELANQVRTWSEGIPLFAVELLSTWIDTRRIRPSPTGFVLGRGAPGLPQRVQELWLERLDGALVQFEDVGPAAVGVAAVLGREVQEDEWLASCEAAGIELSPVEASALTATLTAARLGRPTLRGWSFAHGMLRRSLLARHMETGTLAELHGACAAALSTGTATGSQLHRAATHFIEANAPDQAAAQGLRAISALAELDALGAAEAARAVASLPRSVAISAGTRVRLGIEIARALRSISDWSGASDALAAAEEAAPPELLGELLVERGWLALLQQRPSEARRLAEEAEYAYEDVMDLRGLARAGLLRAEADYKVGDLTSALGGYADAVAHAEASGERRLLADCVRWQARALVRAPEREEDAAATLATAIRLADDDVIRASLLREKANLAIRTGDLDGAQRDLAEAAAKFGESGYDSELHTTAMSLGDLLRSRALQERAERYRSGDTSVLPEFAGGAAELAPAAKLYAGAVARFSAAGLTGEEVFARLNGCIVDAMLGRPLSDSLAVAVRMLPRKVPPHLRAYVSALQVLAGMDEGLPALQAGLLAAQDHLDTGRIDPERPCFFNEIDSLCLLVAVARATTDDRIRSDVVHLLDQFANRSSDLPGYCFAAARTLPAPHVE